MCTRTIYDARNNFSALVKIAESGEPVELTRHDKPVAVLISWEDYQKTKPKKSFVKHIMEIRKKYSDLLSDPSWKGLEIPKDDLLDDDYTKRIKAMWGEE